MHSTSFFLFPPAESAKLFEGLCQVFPRRPLPNVLLVQSPIGLTKHSHGSGISEELKVISCDVSLSGITCRVLVVVVAVVGGVGREELLTLVTFLTRNRRVMTSSSADMDRNSTSMGPYCCRPGSGQYCTHGCSQRKKREAEEEEETEA